MVFFPRRAMADWRAQLFQSPPPSGATGLGVDYVRGCESVLAVDLPYHGKTLELEQDDSIGLGGVVWDCGLLLSRFIDESSMSSSIMSSSMSSSAAPARPVLAPGMFGQILDLGSGTGVVGLAGHVCLAPQDRTILTDLDCLLDLERRNVERSGLNAGAVAGTPTPATSFRRVEVAGFDWSAADHESLRKMLLPATGGPPAASGAAAEEATKEEPDASTMLPVLVTCSDALYDEANYPHLLRILGGGAVGRGIGTMPLPLPAPLPLHLLFAYKMRHPDREQAFFEALDAAGFDIWVDAEAATRLLSTPAGEAKVAGCASPVSSAASSAVAAPSSAGQPSPSPPEDAPFSSAAPVARAKTAAGLYVVYARKRG